MILVIGFSLLLGIVLAFSVSQPLMPFAIALLLVMPLVIWRHTRLTVYLLIGAATIFESFSLGYPDSITDRVPFFKSLDSFTTSGIPVSPAEILMLLALVILVVKRVGAREKPLALGPLFVPVAFYTFMVLFGLVRGMGTGGDLSLALWEARAQVYLFLAYLLAYNLIQDKGQVKVIVWFFLAGVALKGLLGSWRFLVTLGGDLSRIDEFTTYNSILSHEESLLFALFLALAFTLFLFRSDRRQLKFALWLSLPVILAFLANERRAGMFALLLCVIIIGLLAYVLLQSRRKLLFVGALVTVIFLPMYVLAFGGSGGLLAQPARAVMSQFNPSERDASSDSYRQIETRNLKYNIGLDPALGQGYGKPIQMFEPLPDISARFSLWEFIPHNTILWVWVRLGLIGFIAFWFMAGSGVIEAVQNAKRLRDPYLKGVAVFCAAAIVVWVMQGALDMGLADFRATILIGTLLGLLASLSRFQEKEEVKTASIAKRQEAAPRVIS
jgi:hypothetical protein